MGHRRVIAVALALVIASPGVAVASWALWTWLTWPDVARLATEQPAATAFIERYRERAATAGERALPEVSWTWVPDARIDTDLHRAVVVAEDIEFFSHDGFSHTEIKAAIRQALEERKAPRGASTISQQLAKNLWLSPSRNPLRKLKEALLTKALERHLNKRRILEIYLNVVEFGPGVYGAEAAARRYFGHSAAILSAPEAAQLAASLPRPMSWHPGVTSRGYLSRVDRITRLMARARFLDRYFGSSSAVPLPAEFPGVDSLLRLDLDSLIPIGESVDPESVGDSLRVGDSSMVEGGDQ